MEELKAQESETLDILEAMLDVCDLDNPGPMFAGQHVRGGICKITDEDAARLRQYIAIRRAKSENESRVENCHVYEPGENVVTIADNCEILIKGANLRKLTADPENDRYLEGVKYAIYEIFKEADIPGSQEIRDSGDTDDGMCARAAERIRAELTAPENKPLTLEQLRQMKGQPVYCIGQTRFDVHFDGWKVVAKNNLTADVIRFTDNTDFPVKVYGERLLAYARKPEGSET